jgi:DNA repair protein SbcC/Rad50
MASEAVLIPTLEGLDDIVDTAEDLLTMLAKFYQKFKDEGQLNQFKELLKENREQLTIIKKRHSEVKEMNELGGAAEIKLDISKLVKSIQQDQRFRKYLEYKHAIELRNYSKNVEGQETRKDPVPIDEPEAKDTSEDVKKYQVEINRLRNEHKKALTALNNKQNEINQLRKQNQKTLNKKQNEINQLKSQKSNAQKGSAPSKDEINALKTQNSKHESIISQKNAEIAQLKSQIKEYAEQIAAFDHLNLEIAGQPEEFYDEKQQNKDLTERIKKLEQQNDQLKKKYKVELIEEEKLVPEEEDLPQLSYEDFKDTYLE